MPLWQLAQSPIFPDLLSTGTPLSIQMAPTSLRFVQDTTNAGFREIYGMLRKESLLALLTTAPLMLVVSIFFATYSSQ